MRAIWLPLLAVLLGATLGGRAPRALGDVTGLRPADLLTVAEGHYPGPARVHLGSAIRTQPLRQADPCGPGVAAPMGYGLDRASAIDLPPAVLATVSGTTDRPFPLFPTGPPPHV
jgi:hypothetical protein